MNKERRKFIKTAYLCGGFLLLGRVAGSIFPGLLKSSESNNNSLSQKRVENTEDGFVFYDKKGNKVLIID